ncbi:hypothetical protein [Anaerotruncus rubiinfantis]|uniref:hypothetical protein n=1 Tax=Anaerotruncus rubiinfantis TaxID=1720200 RepID=UPI003D799FB7
MNTANVAVVIFNAFEKFENDWQADLCTRSKEKLQPAVDATVGLRSKSQWMTLTILREYVKWCIAMKVPEACDGMLLIEAVGLDKVRHQMVSSPLHLQKYLDDIFDPESDETIDNLYRCYFWMAYGGIDEGDTVLVKAEDVDFEQMSIFYKNTSVPIYREAIPAFRNAVSLTSFSYKHPKYSKIIYRDRIPGDTVMRGIKATTKVFTMRTTLSKRNIKAVEDGDTDLQLSFYRVRMSGLFYRVYERERAGIPIDFSDAAVRAMDGKTYSLSGRYKLEHKQNRIERDYMEDYQRWKLAFSI